MLIAQISDLHIRKQGELASRVVDTAGCLERCVTRLNSLEPRPDLAILTGDLVDSGHPEEYRHLRQMLEPLKMPYYLMPGNHDAREPLRSVFSDHAYLNRGGEFIQHVIAGYPVRLILLDTLDPGNDAGLMDEARLSWLEARLAEAPGEPTLVFMHHPPFITGIRFMDEINCRGADKMAGIIRNNPQVERVLCGHVHRPIQTRWAGTVACTAPSTAHQSVVDLREEGVPGEFSLEPPGFLLHLWRPGMGLVTHNCVVDAFEGPYRFDD